MSTPPLTTKTLIRSYEEGSIPGSHDSSSDGDRKEPTRESYQPEVSGQTKKLAQVYHEHATKRPTEQPTGSELLVRRISKEDQRMRPWTQAPVKHKILIVYAHWERTSFNGALLDTAVDALTAQGHEVTVTDLYAQGFNPLPSRNDILDGPRNPDHFSYPTETGLAYVRGTLVPDVAEEQAKLTRADTVIFQFPLNWGTVPAILKGYFDRVLTQKFAYDSGKFFDKGKFKGRTAILSMTTGMPESAFSTDGFMGDINVILWPIQNCILRFCGWDVLSPNICFSPTRASDAERTAMLTSWKERLTSDLWKEPLLRFIPIEHFDSATCRLSDEALGKLLAPPSPSVEDEEMPPSKPWILPIGQHAGRQVAPGSMYRAGVSTYTQNGGQ